jgi:hypothetical protein
VNRTIGEVRQRANQAGQRLNQQVGRRVNQVDPLVAGAAAAAVLVGVTVLFLVRRRRR